MLAQGSSSGALRQINQQKCDQQVIKIPLRSFTVAEARAQLAKYVGSGKHEPADISEGDGEGRGRLREVALTACIISCAQTP